MKRQFLIIHLSIMLLLYGCVVQTAPVLTVEQATRQPAHTETKNSSKHVTPPAAGNTATESKILPTRIETDPSDMDKIPGTDTVRLEQTKIPSPESKTTRSLSSNAWKGMPIIPHVSDNVKTIYKRGLELGRNPDVYSKIGDCGSTPTWFMGDFDRGPKYYDLGEYQYLDEVISEFAGSHERTSLAARAGFNAPSLFVPLWSDIKLCDPNEGPLECEYRVNNPIVAFIMLGANDIWHPDEFEPSMRKIIEYSIDNGVIPILSTKADNQEGDGSINFTIANLAIEYDIPLVNFWQAVQDIPNQGLQEDGVHMTWGNNDFTDPKSMNTAWTIRNLTALQTLDAVWRKAIEPP